MVVSGYLLMACLFTCTCVNVLKSPQRSSSCLVAHKAFKESFHFSRLAVVVFTSSHDCHPASALSFSTVLPRVVFGTHDVYVSTGHFSRYLRNVTIPLLYSVCTFQFLIFPIFLGCIGCQFSSVVSCCLWTPRIIESPLL